MLVKLADPTQTLPWPGQPMRLQTGPEPFEVDVGHPFWRTCWQDGSIVRAEPEVKPAPLASPAKPAPKD